MTIKTQTWEPDTCANPATRDVCILEETWDDTVPPESRTHTFSRAIQLCSRHAATHGIDHLAAYVANYAENDRKNITLRASYNIKNTINFNNITWYFDAAGVLYIDCASELTNPQKNNLQSQADIQFGPGKVVIL